MITHYQGVELNVDWRPGSGARTRDLPNAPGIYAEIYWPEAAVRIGETGRSIRAKVQHDVRWFNSLRAGTAPQSQMRRTIPIATVAKQHGADAFEFYVVSADPVLIEKNLRQACERHMFTWVESNPVYTNWNFQRSWR